MGISWALSARLVAVTITSSTCWATAVDVIPTDNAATIAANGLGE